VGLGYLVQAGRGQLAMINHARPMAEVLHDERTPPHVRDILARIPSMKAFGERYGLKPTKNYTEYVKLDRPAASWVVSASEPLRFRSKEWSFPIVGSFPYLGWFDLDQAKRYADELRAEGWDVDLRGASAYSTLGWFRDPVLSSMIPAGDDALGEVVNVILHESVHATYYINGQAYLNESLASWVADQLTPEYLRAEAPAQLKPYLDAEAESDRRQEALFAAYGELKRLYESARPDAEKRAEKERVLTELQARLKFRRPVNNATLIQFRTYGVGRKEYAALWAACGQDWSRFWKALGRLNADSFVKPHQEDLGAVLGPLVRAGCS
jgi:predicted aminopeptidase